MSTLLVWLSTPILGLDRILPVSARPPINPKPRLLKNFLLFAAIYLTTLYK